MRCNRLLSFGLLMVSLTLSACGNNSGKDHEHSWSTPTYTWSNDFSTCVAERVCSEDSSHIETEIATATYNIVSSAKCEVDGVGRYTAEFNNSSFKTQTHDITLNATGHHWGSVSYQWNNDNTQCTATRICNNDSNHVETETVNSIYSVIDAPTYDEDGVGRYSVSFTNNAFSTQTKDITLSKLERLAFVKYDDHYAVKADSTSIDGNIVIPSTYNELPVTTIEEKAFLNCIAITSILLPESIVSIGKSAFAGCTGLTTINIPGLVNGLYDQTFNGCTSLKTITIEDGVSFIGTRNGGSWCFKNCNSLEELVLPDSISLIGCYAFQGCTSLRDVAWPDNSLEICTGAFFQCESLRSIPTKVSEINTYAFASCNSLTEVVVPHAYLPGSEIFASCKSIKKAVFSEGITKIPDNIFNNCSSLTQVIISSTINDVGQFPFVDCTQLHEVVNKSSLSLSKDDEAFLYCNIEAIITSEDYSKLSVLDGITYYIKTNAKVLMVDYNDKNCSSLTIPSYITQIGNAALYNFIKLSTLNYEGTIEEWQNITKGSDWNHGVITSQVHCTDGDVTL